jgi:transketolase
VCEHTSNIDQWYQGSLGQGLGVACGMAYTGKYFDKAAYRVYCVLGMKTLLFFRSICVIDRRAYVLKGDGETTKGSVWEAINFAAIYKVPPSLSNV